MEPFEIMVSESQERMLCVVEPGRVDEVIAVSDKWEVHGTAIGEVTDTRRMRVFDGDELVGDMPVARSSTTARSTTSSRPSPSAPIYAPPSATLSPDATPPTRCWSCSASPNIASRRPLFEQYDSIVQSRTARRPEQSDAAVLMLPDGGALA